MTMFEFDFISFIEILGAINTENLALILMSFSFCFSVWCLRNSTK